jgi:hypothetical protein
MQRNAAMAAKSKKCPKCGSQIEPGALVCSVCKRVDFWGALKDDPILLVILALLACLTGGLLLFLLRELLAIGHGEN